MNFILNQKTLVSIREKIKKKKNKKKKNENY
jgi:hypothetical protein